MKSIRISNAEIITYLVINSLYVLISAVAEFIYSIIMLDGYLSYADREEVLGYLVSTVALVSSIVALVFIIQALVTSRQIRKCQKTAISSIFMCIEHLMLLAFIVISDSGYSLLAIIIIVITEVIAYRAIVTMEKLKRLVLIDIQIKRQQ